MIMIAALTLCCTGCEKKADVIEGYVDTSEEESSDGSDTVEGSEAGDSETGNADKTVVKTENWNDELEGGDKGFGTVDIALAFKDYSDKEFSTTTVEFEEFDADFAKKMCETVFDGGEV